MAMGSIALLTLVLIIGDSAASQNQTADACVDHGVEFDRVFAVPHEAALLECQLVKDNLFDIFNISYDVTWYDQKTDLELTGEDNNTVLGRSSLLFRSVNMEHQGRYLCIVRTKDQCYKQVRVLVVEEMVLGTCGRPRTSLQRMQGHINDNLRCPLSDYVNTVDSYSIHWYKDCELLQEGSRFQFTDDDLMLHVHKVSQVDVGFYTCRMTFNLSGIVSVVAETIECEITETHLRRPQMLEPTQNTIKVTPGSPINKTCRVFLPGKGVHLTMVSWKFKGEVVSLHTSDRIHQGQLREHKVTEGSWLERSLLVTQVLPEDLNENFTCWAESHQGTAFGFFAFQPADPNLLLPIGLLATTMVLHFIMGLLLYRLFKVELALLFRTLFPFFYASTDGDGKLYDAYVVYPRVQGDTLSEVIEIFAMTTLPQILEERYGYRLFILGRDSLPGQALTDVMEETMNVCRRLLLLYTSSSLSRAEGSSWYEQQTGLHRAILEESLTVVLLEMDQISDPSILPKALHLLRNKQGVIQAWKKSKRWMCIRMEEHGEEDEAPLSLFALSASFWRRVRYYMPVRGKAKQNKRKVFLNF